MKDFTILEIIITVVIAIGGWYIVHYLNSERDNRNKRKELVTKHLIKCYSLLTNLVSGGQIDNPEIFDALKIVLNDVQLFGTKKQIELVKKVVHEIVNNKSANLNELIVEMRDDLRLELNLDKVNGGVLWLR